MKYQWPENDTQVVNCPNCGNSCEVDLELVKELSLPLRPADCLNCDAEFELNHDGTTKLIRAHPLVSNAGATGEIRNKLKNFVFNPD
ncbi:MULTISPECIES: hypothetical protein [Enterobacteriaceae]|uniref:hypothetical protein n=1 Tax=Enterobacteriaceae TaxID=543 RepID=UPI000BE5AB40|nr:MULTISPECIES: hypothetical protein [Enterobacteriaceae]MDH1753921.1 hypothetical protein [Citrobacter freundii]HAU6861796.1 hypothetical protein [Salmonella enterica subsp. enterica serovar Senftenberg]